MTTFRERQATVTNSRVTIIVVNWKLKDRTHRCLRSVSQLTTPHDLVVVDNGSDDGSVEMLIRDFPYIQLISLPLNTGFGTACNIAAQQAFSRPTCDYVFLLNNDTEIHPNALQRLLSVADNYTEGGIFGPKIYYSDQPQKIWHMGANRRPWVLAAVDIARGAYDSGQYEEVRKVDYIFGAAMLISRTLVERIGMFDNRYFLYLEDLDLCIRAQKSGFPIVCVPKAVVWHDVSASTAHYQHVRIYHHVRSTIIFLKSHLRWPHVPLAILFWTVVFLRAVALSLWQRDIRLVRSYYTGLVSGLAGTHCEIERNERRQMVRKC